MTWFHTKVIGSDTAAPPVGDTNVGGAAIGALNAMLNVTTLDGML